MRLNGNKKLKTTATILAALLALGLTLPLGSQAGTDVSTMTKYILETVKAFRSVYAKGIVSKAKQGGVHPSENWRKDSHALMLPAQFVKAAATKIKGYELGLIGLQPIYKSNLPRSEAEKNALMELTQSRNTDVVVFRDGNAVKGLVGDFAVAQSCVTCHNQHPKSPKKDFKMGDLMGALVVRISE